MFRRLSDRKERSVPFVFNGVPTRAREGDSVAAALLAAGNGSTRRSPVSGAARGPYCMMGVCFECLVKIDGRPNRQGCMTTVAEGMRIETQDGAAMPGQEE
ncbi:2Fe-2S iron-sulfur cluster binding domain-containing protein [Rhizobium aethiopicum]|uniref:2Fe-2S iron-sulfur cluster binding domain-containing protein n=1 Tax=Rhizobium aethiopicum TaxID=1138170 RepID=A0A1C3YBX3_9HYPH|nr:MULTISPECIES: (2Fe-2S)-binding protein [Rhizobium]SCB61943.1 2Fe-2S iron-sulfur cluster binding domain-containing protein [Rhizobium aethiopicum]